MDQSIDQSIRKSPKPKVKMKVLNCFVFCRTIESVIRKVMESQEDWYWMLDSVLFAIWVTKHASTGQTPFHMLYSKDPILPFEYTDRSDNLITEYEKYGLDLSSSGKSSSADPITSILSHIEDK